MSGDQKVIPKQEQRRRVEEGYEDKLKELDQEIERVQDDGNETLEILRKSQLQRLTHLIDRKKSIEADLVKHAGELQEAYERTKGEVQVVLEGRMTDLRGAEGYNRVKDAHSGKGKARAAE